MTWMDDVEKRWPLNALAMRLGGKIDSGTLTGDLHRTIRALREAEAALEKIQKKAIEGFNASGTIDMDERRYDYIEMTANEALGLIARGGDEQPCPTCGGTKTSPVHIGDGRIEDRPCPTCSKRSEKTKS